MLAVFFIDAEWYIIPNTLVLAAMVPAAAACARHAIAAISAGSRGAYDMFSPYAGESALAPLLGLVPGAAFFLAVYAVAAICFRNARAVGMGDIKLYIPVGLILGIRLCLAAVFISVVSGGLCGAALILLGKKTRKDSIPLGPFIVVGALAALIGWRLI
jgi:leader peptidase (prepilin peptidase)/N-methyltransferase